MIFVFGGFQLHCWRIGYNDRSLVVFISCPEKKLRPSLGRFTTAVRQILQIQVLSLRK
jgi:hypothetical protein